MSHPSSCKHPDTCTLSYRDHLLGISITSTALPSRFPEAARTNIREKRWARDIPAFKRLHAEGVSPPQIDGSALRERRGETVYDITERPVTIDYSDPR